MNIFNKYHSEFKNIYKVSGNNNCSIYAPFYYRGRCRYCAQDYFNHSKYSYYNLNTTKIQNAWRCYVSRRKLLYLNIKKLLKERIPPEIINIILFYV